MFVGNRCVDPSVTNHWLNHVEKSPHVTSEKPHVWYLNDTLLSWLNKQKNPVSGEISVSPGLNQLVYLIHSGEDLLLIMAILVC